MKTLIIEFVNPIMIVVFITFMIGLFALNLKKENHFFLFLILLICSLTELIALLLKVFDRTKYISLLYDVSIFFFLSIWITVLLRNFAIFNKGKWVLMLFILFAFFNYVFFQSSHVFNFYTYIFGSLIYILLFFERSFLYLKNQNFSFLFSNTYILLTAPLALLFGLSFMFVFVDRSITDVIIFGTIKLYDFVCIGINMVFYMLSILYMFKEFKIKNE